MGWKIYFWIFLFLSALSVFSVLPVLSTFNIAGYEGLIELVILNTGLYAYVFRKNLFKLSHWRIVFWAIIAVWTGGVLYYSNAIPILTPFLAFLEINPPQQYYEVIASILLSSPALYAIYALGFLRKAKKR